MRLSSRDWTWVWRKSRWTWSKRSSNYLFLEANYAYENEERKLGAALSSRLFEEIVEYLKRDMLKFLQLEWIW